MTPQSIRDVRFREKVRGYHPTDVDDFVATVAAAVEELEQRVEAAESRVVELEARTGEASDVEDSLRRTLVLAQRTADLAIQEAREEAARLLAEATEQRDNLVAETDELRSNLHAEVHSEVSDERDRLQAERAALQADVEALDQHLARERERLRIYFTDQLRRVDEGVPGTDAAPEMQAAPAEPAVDGAPQEAQVGGDEPAEVTGGQGDGHGDGAGDGDGAGEGSNDPDAAPGGDDDPFLAELRRAVTDEEPLGPRDNPVAKSEDGDDGFDLFASGGDDAGRFGSRLRRRR
jgi:cell division initiation protein